MHQGCNPTSTHPRLQPNASEARRIGAAAHGSACRFVYMGSAGAHDAEIFARDAAGRITAVDRPHAREAQARRATPVLLVPEGPLTLEDGGTASEQAGLAATVCARGGNRM